MRGVLSRLGAALCCVIAGACGQPATLVGPASSAPSTVPSVQAVATVVDTDGDGVPDPQDSCPLDAETRNNYIDEDGCPDEIPCEPPARSLIPNVGFPMGGDTLDAEAIDILERTTRMLQDHSEVTLEISGHTDNRGSRTDNQAMSLRRAEVVRDYFVERGIDPARLTVKGYGEDNPIARNDDEAGRATNRRVEFEITNP